MRRALTTVLTVVVVLCSAALAGPPATPYGFVSVDATGKGFQLYGQPFRYVGTNCYYLADYATNFTYDDGGNAIANSRQYVNEVLDEARGLGVKVVRTWAFGAGNASQPLGGKYNLFESGAPGNYIENTFRGLDYVVAEAGKRGMRVVLPLVNNWDDYGGMKWYVEHSATANQALAGDAYHDQFYSDADCRAFYKNYVNNLLNRVNTITGRRYKDDPTILAWELGNEARAKSAAPATALLDGWVGEMSAYIKGIDSGHMVTTGLEGWGSPWEGTNFVSSQAAGSVDYATLHFYPDSWDWFATNSLDTNGLHLAAGIDANKIDWWTAKTGITYLDPAWGNVYSPDEGVGGFDNWAAQNADWATNLLGKPVVLEEFALLKSNPDALEDRFYRQAIDSFFGAGGDGVMLWAQAHDDYAARVPTMDDGYLYYVSTDPALSGPSGPALGAIGYAMANWEDTPDGDPALVAPVPEPGAGAAALLGLAMWSLGRRRRLDGGR